MGDEMTVMRDIVRVVIAALLVTTGTLHLAAPDVFYAQVPDFLPFRVAIVYLSGIIEIVLAVGLLWPRFKRRAAITAALFFVIIFPGNIWQAVAQVDAFGLDTDLRRIVRLAFQPVLILAVLFGGNVARKLPHRGGTST
ncbi:MAG: hypothetical protein WD360_05280 [Nitriliruptoraceae bacterium]